MKKSSNNHITSCKQPFFFSGNAPLPESLFLLLRNILSLTVKGIGICYPKICHWAIKTIFELKAFEFLESLICLKAERHPPRTPKERNSPKSPPGATL